MFEASLAQILQFSEKTFRCLFLSKAITFEPICESDASSKRFFTRVAFVGVDLLILPCIDSWTNECNESDPRFRTEDKVHFRCRRRRNLLVNSWQPMTEWNHCACGRFSNSRGLSASVSFLSSPPPPPTFTRFIFALQFFAPEPHRNACYAGYMLAL